MASLMVWLSPLYIVKNSRIEQTSQFCFVFAHDFYQDLNFKGILVFQYFHSISPLMAQSHLLFGHLIFLTEVVRG